MMKTGTAQRTNNKNAWPSRGISHCVGRGRLVAYEELTNEVRNRNRMGGGYELDADAVVGILDLRLKAAACPAGKAHGASGIPADAHKAAPTEMARLLVPVSVEATLSADAPLFWQGGGGGNTGIEKTFFWGVWILTKTT